MKKLTALILLITTPYVVLADQSADHAMHQADVFVDGSAVDIEPKADRMVLYHSELPRSS